MLYSKNILLQKAINSAKIDGLNNVLYNNSRGKYNYEKTVDLKALATNTIGLYTPAIELQILCLIKQLRLYKK